MILECITVLVDGAILAGAPPIRCLLIHVPRFLFRFVVWFFFSGRREKMIVGRVSVKWVAGAWDLVGVGIRVIYISTTAIHWGKDLVWCTLCFERNPKPATNGHPSIIPFVNVLDRAHFICSRVAQWMKKATISRGVRFDFTGRFELFYLAQPSSIRHLKKSRVHQPCVWRILLGCCTWSWDCPKSGFASS